eukprot:Clim_evm29s147 gene=Clim_evmTU29s147
MDREGFSKEQIMHKLEQSGEKERLKEKLRKRLVESGWRDRLKQDCIVSLKQKDTEQITLEQLVAELTPKARASVPDDIRASLVHDIREYLSTIKRVAVIERSVPSCVIRNDLSVTRSAVISLYVEFN